MNPRTHCVFHSLWTSELHSSKVLYPHSVETLCLYQQCLISSWIFSFFSKIQRKGMDGVFQWMRWLCTSTIIILQNLIRRSQNINGRFKEQANLKHDLNHRGAKQLESMASLLTWQAFYIRRKMGRAHKLERNAWWPENSFPETVSCRPQHICTDRCCHDRSTPHTVALSLE